MEVMIMSKLKELEDMLTQGKISRREFLARVSALSLTAALSPALLSSPVNAATPKKGGRLRIGCGGGATTDTLDPGNLSDSMAISVNWQIRNNLVEIDHKGDAIAELAESWESSPDAVQWIFKLRQGVEFHNGKTLDAKDVIFSINHHRGEKSKSGGKVIAESIKEMKADGKNTVIFTLKGGNADFPFMLSDYHLTISPDGTTDFGKGIGTGGYMLVDFEPGVRGLVKRNPNFFKKGRAHFDEVETIGINDVTARTNALMTGRADVVNRIERKTARLLEKRSGIQVLNIQGPQFYSFPMLCDVAPYDNKDVRLALKYAVDRESMVATILRGYGSVGNDHPISSILKFHASELPQRKYDPEKAQYHIKKAGFEGHTFKLHVADAACGGAVDAAVLYREHAAKAGINIQVVQESGDGYWSNVWLSKPWCAAWWSGRSTADWMFSVEFAADAAWNDSHWKNDRFNKLLKEARAELNENKRREMYVEMQKIARDDSGVVIPMFANHVEASTTKLKFDKVAGNWELDGTRIAERWWFA
jgi:peptide/nickel transport system substrate-binding protein